MPYPNKRSIIGLASAEAVLRVRKEQWTGHKVLEKSRRAIYDTLLYEHFHL